MPEVNPPPPAFGRYKDPVMLGSGGMGAVYRAVDPMLDRYVAIKVLTHREPRYVERFRREAQVLARIMHPSIIQIYEIVGTDEDSSDPYIVMEFFEGQPLDGAIKGGPLSQAQVVSILRQTAEGLRRAHTANVIHRDIKPANIMLAKNGEVKILDFGIAKTKDAKKDLTGQTVLGTPYYMSPEQAMGYPIDPRTDLYSLGITAFHLLAGRRPFEAKSKVDVMLAQVKQPLPDIAQYVQLDARIKDIVEKLCAKKPEERFQSCDELIETLDSLPKSLGGKAETGRYRIGGTTTDEMPVAPQHVETPLPKPPPPRPAQMVSNPARLPPLIAQTPPPQRQPQTPPAPRAQQPATPTAPRLQPPAQAKAAPRPEPRAAVQQPAKRGTHPALIGMFSAIAVLALAGAGVWFKLHEKPPVELGKVPQQNWIKQGKLREIQRQGGYGNCVFAGKEIDPATEDGSGLRSVFVSGDPIFGRCFFPAAVGPNKQGEIYQELWIDGQKRAQVVYDPIATDSDSILIALSQQQADKLAALSSGKHTLALWIYREANDAETPEPLAAGELIVRK